MADEDAGEGIDAIVTEDVEGDGSCNGPQLDRFYVEHMSGIVDRFHGGRVALLAMREEQGGRLVEHGMIITSGMGVGQRPLDFQGNCRVW